MTDTPISGYVDKNGVTYAPDPTRRHMFRAVVDGAWTARVTDRKWGKPSDDPDGAAELAGIQVNLVASGPDGEARPWPLTLPPGTDQYEYKVVSATFGDSLEATLNQYGQYGWEVISLSAANGTWTLTGNKLFAMMKRRIPATPPPLPGQE